MANNDRQDEAHHEKTTQSKRQPYSANTAGPASGKKSKFRDCETRSKQVKWKATGSMGPSRDSPKGASGMFRLRFAGLVKTCTSRPFSQPPSPCFEFTGPSSPRDARAKERFYSLNRQRARQARRNHQQAVMT